MLTGPYKKIHLSYCTNIHAANGWENVFSEIKAHAPAIRAHVSPDEPFGIGLRLSHTESQEILEGNKLAEFKTFLDEHKLYVYTMNGFPYGTFHGEPVKDDVFAPDWTTQERLIYTKRLLDILIELLPKDIEGGISTIPLSYKPWNTETKTTRKTIAKNLAAFVMYAYKKEQETGKHVHLDIEPEPFGLVETTAEFISFMKESMLPEGTTVLTKELGVTKKVAQELLRKYVCICFDTCHAAVEYEDAKQSLERLEKAHLRVGKVQISSGLKVVFEKEDDVEELLKVLKELQDPVYLHQVIVREKNKLTAYKDLHEAIEEIGVGQEWRIHFHTPLFVSRYGMLESTQEYVKDVLHYLKRRKLCTHFEIETYTWDVLPEQLKEELTLSIIKEYEWVLGIIHDA